MIPKVIHYCWFGGNPLPELAQKCIASWKKYCPDYEIKEWNESNFDLNCCDYVREAYEAKKWAFVSDVARLYAMVHEGGIYMDTDVEVIAPLDSLLQYHAVSGFETEHSIPTGLMACEKGNPMFTEFLNEYKTAHFLLPDSSLDQTTNVVRITNISLFQTIRNRRFALLHCSHKIIYVLKALKQVKQNSLKTPLRFIISMVRGDPSKKFTRPNFPEN